MAQKSLYLKHVDKVAQSRVMHGSESLCKLLGYLAHHALEHPGTPLKEYQIATEIFGRSGDFDPQVDSIVRVQAGRLRAKLAEYYASEGEEDTIWVDLPKGTYVLSFHNGVPAGSKSHLNNSFDERDRERPMVRQVPRKWAVAVGVLSILLAIAVTVIALQRFNRKTSGAELTGVNEQAPVPIQVFWKGFLTGPEEPWVIFSNAAFIGRPDVGMRYYDSTRDSKALIRDHYTGVGEVLAVHDLDNVFGMLHRPIRVKRGSLFSLDDAKNNDLIFIGSPSENLTLLEIPGTREFTFKRIDSGPSRGNMEIINAHPQPGEHEKFFVTPSNPPLTEDYSVVALIRGINPQHSVLILAGNTTIGTQAAVEYVSRLSSLEELLRRLSVSKPTELKPFEAVIHVKVARGVPMSPELVAVRKVAP